MDDVRSGMERRCTFGDCNGRMRAGSAIGDLPPLSHVWQCNENDDHTTTCSDADIADEDILQPEG